MMWDLHVRLHRTQFLCRQLLYTVSTRMCNLFWTRSGKKAFVPVWWVFLACTEQNLSVPWISTCSRLETDSAKGYTGWETWELLIRIWVYCLLRITISLIDQHNPTQVQLTIIQLEELNCRQFGKVAGGARISSELHRPTLVMVSLFPTRSEI